MSNTIPAGTLQLMPNILGAALEVLRQEAAMATVVNHNFDDAEGSVGQVVNIAKAAPLSATDVTPAAVPPNLTDITFGYTQITINKWKKAIFYLNAQDATFFQTGVLIPLQVREAVRSLAYQLNADIFASANANVYGFAGTAGTNPFNTNVNPAADVKKVLDDQLCPPGNRYLVLGHQEVQKALQLQELKYMLNAGDNGALRRGAVGNLFGMQTMGDIQLPTFTAGTDNGSYVIDGTGNTAVGSTIIKLKTGSGTILAGDLVTITSGSVGYQYTVTVALSANLMTISPGLQVAATDGDTVVTAGHGTTYRRNLAFDPSAFGLVMRVPPSSIEGAPLYGVHMSMTDPKTGMSLKLAYLPGYHAAQWELSIMYGVNCVDPRKAAFLLG